MRPPPIAIVDCNNFYWSCECLFAPWLRGRPGVVLSNNDGCAIARSNEAKALGIVMGAPWHLNRRQWERWGVIVRSSNYTLYGDLSRRVMEILARFTPELEVYSIDEAFLNLDGFGSRLDSHARDLRATVLRSTGIPVSVGIAPTKTLAKVANRLAKKDPASGGVLAVLTAAEQEAALARIELTDIWGIAGRLATRLGDVGIRTPLELRQADPRFIRQKFSVVVERTVRELQGESCICLEESRPDNKTIIASRSFGRPVESRDELAESVAFHASRAAEKMRRQGLAVGALMTFINTNWHKPQDAQYYAQQQVQLAVPSADTPRVVRAAVRGLQEIYRPGFRYKKAGVVFLELHRAEAVQGDLFASPDSLDSQALMQAMDGLNRRYGRGTLTIGTAGRSHGWKLRSEHMSPRRTTSWSDLISIG